MKIIKNKDKSIQEVLSEKFKDLGFNRTEVSNPVMIWIKNRIYHYFEHSAKIRCDTESTGLVILINSVFQDTAKLKALESDIQQMKEICSMLLKSSFGHVVICGNCLYYDGGAPVGWCDYS